MRKTFKKSMKKISLRKRWKLLLRMTAAKQKLMMRNKLILLL